MNIQKIVKEMTLEEKAALCSGRDFWHTKAIKRLGIPAIMMCDGPHGLRKQDGEGDHMGINESIKAVCFPTASAMAASFDRGILKKLGETLGEECQAENIAILLGPGVNIKRSPLCGRNFEYFSEDPYLSGELAAAYVVGLQSKGVAACVKHFAANNQESNRMNGDMILDERTLHEIYLPAFKKVVQEAKVQSVMCSYNKINGIYSAENKELLTDILRDKWEFTGFVVTDWGAVKDRVKGIEAGLDLEMPGGSGVQDSKIIEAVKNGELDEKLLDETVYRLLKYIYEYQKNRKAKSVFDREQDRLLSGEMEKECAVLLKNDGNILPVDRRKKIAFIGEFAEKPRYQGSGSSHINVAHVTSALEAKGDMDVIYARGYNAKEIDVDEKLQTEAINAAKEADYAVVFSGLTEELETEGADREHLDMPRNQNSLIEAVSAVQPNTIVVLHAGAPVAMPWIDKVPAVLNLYLGGENVGMAAVSILTGDTNPSGKLAESWPIRIEDNPSYLNFPGNRGKSEYHEGIYVGYRYYDKKKMKVLFPFGYGMSYTTFSYSNLRIVQDRENDTGAVMVRFKVKNTGARAGKEAAQIYLGIKESEVQRPVRELKGFEKIALKPGEEKEVCITLKKNDFAFYDVNKHGWRVEPGEYIIEVGASSRDIRLSEIIRMKGEEEKIVFTRETSVGQLMKTSKGKEVIAMLMQQGKDETEIESAALGEGSERMMAKMMEEMPLGTIVTYGRMTEEQLEQLLTMLNS